MYHKIQSWDLYCFLYINDLQNITSLKVLNLADNTLLYTTFKKHTYIQDSNKLKVELKIDQIGL